MKNSMAKLNAPLFSFTARKGISHLVSFARIGAKNTVRSTPKPLDARTSAQLTWRSLYQQCSLMWHALSSAEKDTWALTARGKAITPYALFMSSCLKPNPGTYLPLVGGTMKGDIDMDSFRILSLTDPLLNQESATKKYVDDEITAALVAHLAATNPHSGSQLIAALVSDQTWKGDTCTLTAGENLTIGQACYMKSDEKMWKAKSDNVATMPTVALATATIAANDPGLFLRSGFFREDNVFSFTVGKLLYVHTATAGSLTHTLPTASGNQVQCAGVCFPSTHIVYFNPGLELVEVT